MCFMRWMVLLLILLLAACETTESPTDLPFYTATPRVTQPVPRPDVTEYAPELFDFTGGDPQAIQGNGSFQFTVTGDVQAAVTGGNIAYNYIPPAGNVTARDTLFISASDATSSQQLAFEFSPGLGVGEHPLSAPGDWIPGRVSVQYLRLSDDGTGQTRIQSYSQNISGNLTLTQIGATLSGTFEFSADWVTGNDSGETVTRSVLLSGQFENVIYARLSNPFDLGNAVPERATPPPLVGSQ
jgi:hypothetical protein